LGLALNGWRKLSCNFSKFFFPQVYSFINTNLTHHPLHSLYHRLAINTANMVEGDVNQAKKSVCAFPALPIRRARGFVSRTSAALLLIPALHHDEQQLILAVYGHAGLHG
jgi:hypothetical protein